MSLYYVCNGQAVYRRWCFNEYNESHNLLPSTIAEGSVYVHAELNLSQRLISGYVLVVVTLRNMNTADFTCVEFSVLRMELHFA